MKILICVPEYPPYTSGVGNVAYNIIRQFKDLGHDCVICSPMGPNIKICNGNLIQRIFHNRSLYYLYGILYFWNKVQNYINNNYNKYDIIWLHNISPITFRINKIKDKKTIMTFHSTYSGFNTKLTHSILLSFYYKIMNRLEYSNLNRLNDSAIITGVSTQTCKELGGTGPNKDQIIYIPNGVDTEIFKPSNNKKKIRETFGISKDDIIILSLGRLTEAKQPQKLIDIFSLIETNIKNITLVIAGNGELLDETKLLVKQKKIDKIKFLGYVDHEKNAPDLYACADFYIMTSKYEGQPLTLLEAMASGLPCIVSKIPNLDIVKIADCGIIVDFNDNNTASKQIIDYIQGKLPLEHSRNAREYTEKNLSWRIMADKYLKVFETIKYDDKDLESGLNAKSKYIGKNIY